LEEGATAEEIRHVALLAITTAGFPTAVAGFGWIDEVLEAD
jgi:alkylhydroperoxidase/carboxymuconolactone decarboxylase family protein YurZ